MQGAGCEVQSKVLGQLKALQHEVRCYDPALLTRPSMLVITKVDLVSASAVRHVVRNVSKSAVPVMGMATSCQQLLEGRMIMVSSETGNGIAELQIRLHSLMQAASPSVQQDVGPEVLKPQIKYVPASDFMDEMAAGWQASQRSMLGASQQTDATKGDWQQVEVHRIYLTVD